MLQYLHVKNLALIDEIEVEFGRGNGKCCMCGTGCNEME